MGSRVEGLGVKGLGVSGVEKLESYKQAIFYSYFRLWLNEHRGPKSACLQMVPAVSTAYLEGQGHLVSRVITPITHIVALVIPLLT